MRVGLVGILGIVFIVLKLLDKIDWSWTWVLAPFWAPIAITFVILLLGGLAAGYNFGGRRRK